jgi:hypothetical protein
VNERRTVTLHVVARSHIHSLLQDQAWPVSIEPDRSGARKRREKEGRREIGGEGHRGLRQIWAVRSGGWWLFLTLSVILFPGYRYWQKIYMLRGAASIQSIRVRVVI